jgi:hypothetical protein
MKTKYLIFFLASLFLISCTKLDESVYDKIPVSEYPETPDQIANLSVDAYTKLLPLGDDNGWWFLANELSGDGLAAPTRGADWADGGKWVNVHRHIWTNDDESVNRMWSAFWTGITTCNQILDLMDQLPQNDALKSKQKEVISLRCFYYYLLIDNYGDAPYLTTTINAPELPYKITRAAIFDSIVNELKTALPYLKPIDRKYMFTKYTGYALLTKLLLNSQVYTGTPRYDEAEVFCDSLMTGPYTLSADVSAPFKTNNENNSEIIFSIGYDEDNAYNLYGPQFDTKGQPIIDGETSTPLVLDPVIPALEMSAADYTPTQIRMSGARVGKYEIKMGAKENLSNDFPLFRLTDFYLIKAECRIRQGQSGDEWINPIRERAGLPAITGATLDQLLRERSYELYCEGVRRQDLIRYNKFGDAWWEKAAHGPERNTFPIPKWATDANPNLLQPPQ